MRLFSGRTYAKPFSWTQLLAYEFAGRREGKLNRLGKGGKENRDMLPLKPGLKGEKKENGIRQGDKKERVLRKTEMGSRGMKEIRNKRKKGFGNCFYIRD